MLKSCGYCGRIHDSRFDCGKRPKKRKSGSQIDKYHSSYRWTKLSRRIKERDHFLCQACLYGLDNQGVRYTTKDLEVHHIFPVNAYWDRRNDFDNLITLCREHHEMAEAGKLSREKMINIVKAAEE